MRPSTCHLHDFYSSRTRFMVETLTNLKNNKLKKNPAGGQGADAVERMKKFLSGLSKKRHGKQAFVHLTTIRLMRCAYSVLGLVMAHEPLRVSLNDLHSAETKGKWWLVGAAWGGDPLVDRQDELQQSNKKADSADSLLLKLAKKQGMNTDIRRSIFVVLMSSEVHPSAFFLCSCTHESSHRITSMPANVCPSSS